MTPCLLRVRGVSKSFPGVRALHDVDLDLGRGEVLAVIGENGAGKSTLMKVLAGVLRPDRGEIRVDGDPVAIDTVRRARGLGIALIHQELELCDNLAVAENLCLGNEPQRAGWIDRRRMYDSARRTLARVGLDVDPRRAVASLSIGQQQLLEVAKALSLGTRILIMDEPTSSLTEGETDRLFGVVRDLQRGGTSILYISHRLGEVADLADRVVVLRDGENAGQLGRDEIDHDAMVRLMVGRDIVPAGARRPPDPGPAALEVIGLRTAAHPDEVLDFRVRAGEVTGIAGLVGAGRTELLQTLFGIDRPRGGTIRVGGSRVELRDATDAIRAGIALVPEDRKRAGLMLDADVGDNLTLCVLRDLARHGFLRRRALRAVAARMVRRLSIRTPSLRRTVRFLSGGNQQKVVVGKWLSLSPRVLLLDEPTRGIDVGAKREVYALLDELAAEGVAILFASSDMEEVLRIADRVLVMHEGRIAGELGRADLGERAVMRLATGGVVE